MRGAGRVIRRQARVRPRVAPRLSIAILLMAVVASSCQPAGEGASTPTAAKGPVVADATTASIEASGRFRSPTLRGRVASKDISESSGLVASRSAPGWYWTHNDSGGGPLVYCVTGTGGVCGAWEVTGAAARDWEDIAIGPGPTAGVAYLYVGDIGDNDAERNSVTIYRTPEPTPAMDDGSSSDNPRATVAAEAIRLTYADGPRDAEALLVHPVTGAIYVIAKKVGEAAVYKADPAGVLRRIASLNLGSSGPVTGADVSGDGRRVALSTYLGGFEVSLPARADAPFDSIWARPAAPVDLGTRTQGESVAYRLDGNALVASSERVPMPIWEAERA